jgi:hypothetical protein
VPGHDGVSADPAGGLTLGRCSSGDGVSNAISCSIVWAEFFDSLRTLLVIDDDRSQNNIMKEATAVIEKTHEQNERRQG